MARADNGVGVEDKIFTLGSSGEVFYFAVATETFAVERNALIKPSFATEQPPAFLWRWEVESKREILLHGKGYVHVVKDV